MSEANCCSSTRALSPPADLAPGKHTSWMGVYCWGAGEWQPATLDGVEQADERIQAGSVVAP